MARRLQNGSPSVFDTIKDSFDSNQIMNKVRGSKETLLWGLFYGGLGFLVGFFFKQYSWYLALLVLFIGILFGLQHMGVITIIVNQAKLSSFFGMQPIVTHDQAVMMFIEWVKVNVFITIAFVVGFLLGIRVG